MSNIGEIKYGRKLGYKSDFEFIWHACLDCGKERWVQLNKGKPTSQRCHFCNNRKLGLNHRGEHSSNWKGGRRKSVDGYIIIKLQPDDFFYPMTDRDGYIKEHRLVVARRLGRCLLKSEPVHHINGVRDDNRDDNLEILNNGSHTLRTKFCHDCEIKREIRLLRLQVKELSASLQEKFIGSEWCRDQGWKEVK